MRKSLPIVVVLAAAATLLALPALAANRSVKIGDDYFARPGGITLTVARGTTVTWTNRGHKPHNVTVTRGPSRFHSAAKLRPGKSYSHRVTRPGTYQIVCSIHYPNQAMTLEVR